MLLMVGAGLDPFIVEDFVPAYLDPEVRATMGKRVAEAVRELECCCACPRNCKVNRLANEMKVCHTGRHARVASAFPHFGEEDCLRGWRGSGTIFFSMCNLRCVFCQNWDISQRQTGRELDASGIADSMLALQECGCHNINFVTPEHVAPQVVEAIAAAANRGLRLPIVYNTSSYDAVSSLRLLDGLVDIYMPDFKFWSRETAARLAKAKDYPDRAREAIREMHRQVGELCFGPDGLARRGLLVRHLVMPGQLDEAREIFRWIADELSPDTYVNIMGQYRPAYEVGGIIQEGRGAGTIRYAEINRCPDSGELEAAYEAARQAGLWRFDERRHD
jgi:putative pyruvate formate lyase activating enzyme